MEGPRRSAKPAPGDQLTNLAKPSAFWARLGAEHTAALTARGPEWVKRTQALRYFTWRWRWLLAIRGEQLRFLLLHVNPIVVFRCVLTPAVLSDAAWEGVSWPKSERWSYTVAVRLLWEYASRHGDRNALQLPEPLLGKPFPVNWRGRLISQDLANSAIEIKAICRAVGADPVRSVLEIGAGYGRTAYVLLSLLPDVTYTVVDIEPALSISRWYLTKLYPQAKLNFLRPDKTASLADASFDVAISISTLQEMTAQQVEDYIALLVRVAAGGMVYLKQLVNWRNPADGITLNFDDYPIPAAWIELFNEVAPVQTSFRQAAWRVPAGYERQSAPPNSMAADRVPASRERQFRES